MWEKFWKAIEEVLFGQLAIKQNMPVETFSQKIYNEAKASLGRKIAPTSLAELGCAITIYRILENCGLPLYVKDPTSTASLYEALETSPDWTPAMTPQAGDVIVSPTGKQGPNSPLQHGHTGIVLNYGIGSNDSYTGTFRENFTLEGWKQHFHDYGEFPIYYFHRG